MIIKPDFRYQHTANRRMPTDVRSRLTSELSYSDCYFLGFRINDIGSSRYHHAWIAADDHESLIYGLSRERENILVDFPLLSDNDIDLIHVQNLMFRHMNISATTKQAIEGHIQKCTMKREDHRFVFLGFVPEKRNIILSSHDTVSAENAFQLGRYKWATELCRPARILAVLQAHPVMKEFMALFGMEAILIESMIGGTQSGLMH